MAHTTSGRPKDAFGKGMKKPQATVRPEGGKPASPEEAPKKKVAEEEEEEEKPKKKRVSEEEEEEEAPKKKRVDEEEEEEEKPKKKATEEDEEEEEETPKKKEEEEEEAPTKKTEDEEDEEEEEKPTPRGKDIVEKEYYRKVDAGKVVTPDDEEEDEEEEERPTAAKPVNTHPLSKYVSLNVLTIVAGVMIMFVIVLSVLCRSGKKPAQYGREVFVMSRRVEEASLLNKASFASPAERPLTQASMSATEEATPIAVSIPAAPVEDNDDSIFDDGEGDTPIVKSHRRSHTKRVRHSKV